jgi:ion channel-forming bestrophin family protein
LNLVVAFSVALKHKLRFEPYTSYEDLSGLVGHLNTLAREATTPDTPVTHKSGPLRFIGEYLGVSFAKSNPRKLIKKSTKPLGNLPLEILSYLASYVDDLVENGQLKVPMQQTLACQSPAHQSALTFTNPGVDNNMASLNEVLTGTERILNTPLPIAYSIAISQITWVYIIMLPFQLYSTLKWVTIPASIIASYIILGILLIGREIENPFGHDVNDLPLDGFCQAIAADLDIISSRKKPAISDFMTSDDNKVMFPLSSSGYPVWAMRSETVIRDELKYKTEVAYSVRKNAEQVLAEEKTGDEKV